MYRGVNALAVAHPHHSETNATLAGPQRSDPWTALAGSMLRGADHPCYDIVVLCSYNSFHLRQRGGKAVKHPWVLGIQTVMVTTIDYVTGISVYLSVFCNTMYSSLHGNPSA